jgi:hypothetical protein
MLCRLLRGQRRNLLLIVVQTIQSKIWATATISDDI